MKYTNTYWEERNLDMSSCEIKIGLADSFEDFTALDSGLREPYRVVKVPVNMPDFLFGLPGLGYVFVETQMQMSVRKEDFKRDIYIPGCDGYKDQIEFSRIETLEELEDVISCIKEGKMFNSDRISLDPFFGKEIGGQRYYNWLVDIFKKNKGVYISRIGGRKLAFTTLEMHKSGVVGSPLGGVFIEAQNDACSFLALYKGTEYAFDVLGAKRQEFGVSSNNTAVLKLHLQRGFKIKSLNYVYIKHVFSGNE